MTNGKQNAEAAQKKVNFYTELLQRLENYQKAEGNTLPNGEDTNKCIKTAKMELEQAQRLLECSKEASYEEMHEILKDYQ